MRVLFVDHVARLSGGELALARLIGSLPPEVECVVVLGEDGPLVERLRDAGARVEVLPMDSGLRDTRRDGVVGVLRRPYALWSFLTYTLELRALIGRLQVDVVHTNSLKAALYGGLAGRLAGKPVIWHVRDRIASDYLPRPVVTAVRLASRVLPTAVVANSQATLSTLPRRKRGAVLPNPVVVDVVLPPPPRGAFRAGPVFRVGVVGRLADWKGQDVFLTAFAKACPAPAEAWIVGSALFGEEHHEERLRQLADDLGISDRVQWRGFRDDVFAELLKLDVLVHCSTTPEPFGQVIVEGMAAGLPVVAAAAGGPLEIIEDGVDGLLTAPGDPEELAASLQSLMADAELRDRLGAAARISSQRYAPAVASAQMTSIYADVLRFAAT